MMTLGWLLPAWRMRAPLAAGATPADGPPVAPALAARGAQHGTAAMPSADASCTDTTAAPVQAVPEEAAPGCSIAPGRAG